MSDIPRTDEASYTVVCYPNLSEPFGEVTIEREKIGNGSCVSVNFARELEHELQQANAQIAALRGAMTYVPPSDGHRWHFLGGLSTIDGPIEVMAATSEDGIGVVAFWKLESDGWHTSAMDTEIGVWEDVTEYSPDDGYSIPLTPPTVWDDLSSTALSSPAPQVVPLADAEALITVLKTGCIGGCTCGTKTPELKYHSEGCTYRSFSEAIEAFRAKHPKKEGA